MKEPVVKITLDLHKESVDTAVSLKHGDTGGRIAITLSEGGFPYEITEDCYAVLTAVKPDGSILYNRCEILGNTVFYEVTAQTTALVGRMTAEVKLYGGEDRLITSAAFRILVQEAVCTGEMVESTGEVSALTHLVSQTLDITRRSDELIAAAETAVQVVEQAAEYIEAAVQNANEAAHRADQFLPAAQAAEQKAEEAIRNVNALREVVSSFHSNIVGEANGEVITIADAADRPLTGLKVFGRTEQFTTTGKNLMQNTAKTATQNGVTFTVNDDGSITMNGTALDTVSAFCTINNSTLQLSEGVRYTLSGCPKHTGVAMFAGQYGNDSGSGYTFTAYTTASSGLSPQIYIRVSSGTTVNNVVVKPMLRLASVTDATYEPYTGGIPAPNPDYPQTLDSVGADGSVAVKVCGKNLFDESKIENKTHPGRYAEFADGRIHFVNNDAVGYVATASLTLTPGTYYLGSSIQTVTGVPTVGYKINSNPSTYATNTFVTLTETSQFELRVTTSGTNTSGEYYANFWITAGESATSYEPYKETQTLSISTPNGLPGIPVASGGNYTDESGQQWICDEVDFEKGVYVQRVVLAKLTSTMNWKYSSSTNRFYTVISNAKADYSYRQFIGLCSHYPAGVQDKNVAISYINEGNEGVAIRDESRFSGDMGAFKAWLDANDVWVLLQAKEQRETALSAEQLAAFALLHTNCPNTTVFNDKNAGMEVKYVADAKWYIDQKFAELAAVLVNQS